MYIDNEKDYKVIRNTKKKTKNVPKKCIKYLILIGTWYLYSDTFCILTISLANSLNHEQDYIKSNVTTRGYF